MACVANKDMCVCACFTSMFCTGRSLSACQESAQLLGGEMMPEQGLLALLGKTGVNGVVGLINLSPYDTWVEQTALKYGKKSGGEITMPSLSLSKNVTVLSYCERSFALHLMQDNSCILHLAIGSCLVTSVRHLEVNVTICRMKFF